MQFRWHGIWLVLLILTGIFALLYLWSALFPGRIDPLALKYFSVEEIMRGRSYSRVPRLIFISGFCLNIVVLYLLAFKGKAAALAQFSQHTMGGSFWGGLLLFTWLVWLIFAAVNVPFTFLSGYYWQRKWGLSTQTLSSWGLDFLKSSGLDLLLFTGAILVFFWLIARWPKAWWVIVSSLFSIWLVVQMYLWPVLVYPLFNRFTPIENPAVVGMVQELSQKAGIPVNEVLVMDASRRTIQANAYFAGLGQTKRIVLYDNLLDNFSMNEVKAVVAHEMAHWRQAHIVRGLFLGTIGSFFIWAFLYAILRYTVPIDYSKSSHILVLVLLFFSLVSFLSNPVQNYISRGMETEADRVAVALTGDVQGTVDLHVNLAKKNISDLAPPYFIKWFSYTHPDVVSRITVIQQ